MAFSPTTKVLTWQQLVDCIADGAKHPDETNWAIYRYLRQNYREADSKEVRMLLAAYMKLQSKKPSLINSCMLALAISVSEQHKDFHFPKFLKAWGYPSCLRDEDRQRQQGKDGRQYEALTTRVERALQMYMLRHPGETGGGASPTSNAAAAACVGFVDGFDEARGFIHVYDSMSRHFVARKSQSPENAERKGTFVSFCPVITPGNSFKSAMITSVLDKYKGREAFGLHTARITYVNPKEQYIRYAITEGSLSAEDGTIEKEGFASTAAMPEDARRQLAVGQFVRLTLFLKRGKDGVKRNHVAEVF